MSGHSESDLTWWVHSAGPLFSGGEWHFVAMLGCSEKRPGVATKNSCWQAYPGRCAPGADTPPPGSPLMSSKKEL